MSSVGSSDSSNRQDNAVRRQREKSQANESELIKKHKKEMRRIAEIHNQELEKLKETHAQQLEELKGETRDRITSRDMKYHKDVEDMRDLHVKQLKQHSEDAARREDTLRKTYESDIEGREHRNDARFERLSKDYSTQLNKNQKQTEETLVNSREAQQDAIQNNKRKQEAAFEKQLKALNDYNNNKIEDLQNKYTDLRQQTDQQLREQEVKHLQDNHHANENLLRAVNKERDVRLEQEQSMRDGYNDSIETMRERFEGAAKKQRDAQEVASLNMKINAVDRIENHIRRLEQEKEDLKDKNINDSVRANHEKNREMNQLRDAMGKNIENWKEQRDEAVRTSNERTAKDVSQVRDELGKQLTDTNRFYRGQMEERNRINRMAYDNLVGDFESRQAHTQNVTNERVKKIHELSEEERARMVKQQGEIHTLTQRQHMDEIKEVREEMEGDKQAAVLRLQDQIRKQEVQHAEKMNLVVSKYEKQIQTLKDQMLRERNLAEENLKRTVDDLQRVHKMAIDQVESKNRDQLRQMTVRQSEELRTVNKRNEEKLDQVLAEVKKT